MANEKRLIDLDLAIERAKESDKIVKSSIWETGEVVEFLEDCPIEDAVEVVHGRWEEATEHDEEFGEIDSFKCSVCGKLSWFEANYCHYCGAKMDGDDNDST